MPFQTASGRPPFLICHAEERLASALVPRGFTARPSNVLSISVLKRKMGDCS